MTTPISDAVATLIGAVFVPFAFLAAGAALAIVFLLGVIAVIANALEP